MGSGCFQGIVSQCGKILVWLASFLNFRYSKQIVLNPFRKKEEKSIFFSVKITEYKKYHSVIKYLSNLICKASNCMSNAEIRP